LALCTLLGAGLSAPVGAAQEVQATPAPVSEPVPAAPAAPVDWQALRAQPEVQALMQKVRKNFRFVKGGKFTMGDFGPLVTPEKLPYNSDADNKYLHQVQLDAFSMQAYKTTYADFDVYSLAMGLPLVGQDPATLDYRHPQSGAGITWYQASAYCQWLGKLLDLPIDLATEAQWEYAARNGGQFVLFATDNGQLDDGRNVWEYDQRIRFIRENRLKYGGGPSLPLGQFPPNPLGLHDMVTDGEEWVQDWYAADYYEVSPAKNPKGPRTGTQKVLRSSTSKSTSGLVYGTGHTTVRSHSDPNPPRLDPVTGELDPLRNPVWGLTARCVSNSPRPVPRGG
jgi:formylglycine-generating enzyme required for sulfatase activity